MAKRASLIGALIAGLLVSLPAFAQAPEPVPTRHEDFDGDVIDGDTARPVGSQEVVRAHAQFNRLFELRRDFTAEIVRSASEL